MTAPLSLLLRVNLLQAWRRLKSVREQSRLLSSFIGLFVIGYLLLSFWLFHKGLKFIATFPGLGTLLTERLLFLLFAFLLPFFKTISIKIAGGIRCMNFIH